MPSRKRNRNKTHSDATAPDLPTFGVFGGDADDFSSEVHADVGYDGPVFDFEYTDGEEDIDLLANARAERVVAALKTLNQTQRQLLALSKAEHIRQYNGRLDLFGGAPDGQGYRLPSRPNGSSISDAKEIEQLLTKGGIPALSGPILDRLITDYGLPRILEGSSFRWALTGKVEVDRAATERQLKAYLSSPPPGYPNSKPFFTTRLLMEQVLNAIVLLAFLSSGADIARWAYTITGALFPWIVFLIKGVGYAFAALLFCFAVVSGGSSR